MLCAGKAIAGVDSENGNRVVFDCRTGANPTTIRQILDNFYHVMNSESFKKEDVGKWLSNEEILAFGDLSKSVDGSSNQLTHNEIAEALKSEFAIDIKNISGCQFILLTLKARHRSNRVLVIGGKSQKYGCHREYFELFQKRIQLMLNLKLGIETDKTLFFPDLLS
jgi:hypothetical protein